MPILRQRIAYLFSSIILLCISSGVQAGSVKRLDDSSSPRATVEAVQVLSERGHSLKDDPKARLAVARFGRVRYRLATAPYVGEQAAIYYVIPANVPGLLSTEALEIQWEGGQMIADGKGYPGDRIKVWSGQIQQAWFEDSVHLNMTLDLRQVRLDQDTEIGFESYFEIEVFP